MAVWNGKEWVEGKLAPKQETPKVEVKEEVPEVFQVKKKSETFKKKGE